MTLVEIHRCLADETRLRILHLLAEGPLCVCHFQDVLRLPQVAVSKHLAYLRSRGMVEATRQEQWMIYRLPERVTPEFSLQMRCLEECVSADPVFRADRQRAQRVRGRAARSGPLASISPKTKGRD